jgi:hypothetical protein
MPGYCTSIGSRCYSTCLSDFGVATTENRIAVGQCTERCIERTTSERYAQEISREVVATLGMTTIGATALLYGAAPNRTFSHRVIWIVTGLTALAASALHVYFGVKTACAGNPCAGWTV